MGQGEAKLVGVLNRSKDSFRCNASMGVLRCPCNGYTYDSDFLNDITQMIQFTWFKD